MFFVLLPGVYTLTAHAIEEIFSKWTLGSVIGSIIVCFFPIINLMFLVGMSQKNTGFRKWKRVFNEPHYCNKCGIYSYYGRALIHEQMDADTIKCPYCGSPDIEEVEMNKGIMGEKFTVYSSIKLALFIFKLKKSMVKQEEDDFLADQMARYIKLEKQKLNAMTKE